MRILVSAFSCAPNAGSEPGVGWRWVTELSKDHDVVVITDVARRSAIEAELALRPIERLKFEYFRPRLLARVPLNSKTAHFLYVLWQLLLLPCARSLHRQHGFHLVMHLTYGVFRHSSLLGFVGPPFVFGPLGGGEDAPWALKKSLAPKERVKELARMAANKAALFGPVLWLAYRSAGLILVKTEESRRALPWPFRERAVVYSEIGIDSRQPVISKRGNGEPLQVLFAGRLLGWKGAHLAIRAVAQACRTGRQLCFTIVGSGSYAAELRKLAAELEVESSIKWIPHVPRADLFKIYARSHCFLFPSLHDSSGNVVLEAMSFGLPVICLDLGGPKTLTTADSSIVVPTSERTEAEVVELLADALRRLDADERARRRMAQAAVTCANGMSWESRVSNLLKLIADRCGSMGEVLAS